MISTTLFEIVFTYSSTPSRSSSNPLEEAYSSGLRPETLTVDQRTVAAAPCSPPTKPSILETPTRRSRASLDLNLIVSAWFPVLMTKSALE